MTGRPDLPLERQLAAALDWWREAGVDLSFEDEPRSLLGANAPEASSVGASPGTRHATTEAEQRAATHRPRIGGDPAGWPQDLAGFRDWWLAEPSLDPGGTAPRVAPRGRAGAELMVLVPTPEVDDCELLLSGSEGRLVAGLLAATGLGEENSYLAAVLPSNLAQPDWPALAREGLGAVLLHHLSLARPKRLLVLGRNVLPLLEHDSSQAPAVNKQTTIHVGKTATTVPTLVAVAPDLLLKNARQRAMLWRRWLDWTDADR